MVVLMTTWGPAPSRWCAAEELREAPTGVGWHTAQNPGGVGVGSAGVESARFLSESPRGGCTVRVGQPSLPQTRAVEAAVMTTSGARRVSPPAGTGGGGSSPTNTWSDASIRASQHWQTCSATTSPPAVRLTCVVWISMPTFSSGKAIFFQGIETPPVRTSDPTIQFRSDLRYDGYVPMLGTFLSYERSLLRSFRSPGIRFDLPTK